MNNPVHIRDVSHFIAREDSKFFRNAPKPAYPMHSDAVRRTLTQAYDIGRHVGVCAKNSTKLVSHNAREDALYHLRIVVEDAIANGGVITPLMARQMGEMLASLSVDSEPDECTHTDDCDCHSDCHDSDYGCVPSDECHHVHRGCDCYDNYHKDDECDHSECYSCDHRTISVDDRDPLDNHITDMSCDNCSKTWSYRDNIGDFRED